MMGYVNEVPFCQGIGKLISSIVEGIVCLLCPELGERWYFSNDQCMSVNFLEVW